MKASAMLMEPGAYLWTAQCPQIAEEFAIMHNKPYCKAIGSLQYTSDGIHPDIMYATSLLPWFNDNPGLGHWKAAVKILAYLHGTLNYKLTYGTIESDMAG